MDKQLQKCTVEYKGRKTQLSEMTNKFYSNINRICIVHKNRQCVMIIIQSGPTYQSTICNTRVRERYTRCMLHVITARHVDAPVSWSFKILPNMGIFPHTHNVKPS